jgi:hypothetical protein
MSGVKVCKTCGVPKHVGKGHVWNSDGTMVQRQDRDHRMILFDSDGVNALFANIEQLIGMPIENIVVESKARATQAYISHLIRGTKGKLAKVVGLERIIRRIVEQGRLLGYGDIHVREFDWDRAYMICDITSPYSLPLFCGDLKGALQAIRKLEGRIAYEKTGPDAYSIRDSEAEGSTGLEDRKAPLEVSGFVWDFSKGTIKQKETGIRYAIFGSTGMQVVLDELERELGDTVPAAIVEAQRMHAASTMSPRMLKVGMEEIRNWLAVQGLGNLAVLEEDGGAYSVRIENPALPLLLVGTMAALFEFLSDRKAHIDWEIAPDGDLSVKVSPAQ